MYKFPAVPRLAVRPLILRIADFLGCDRTGPAWRCWLLVVLYVLVVSGMVDRIAYILSYNPVDHVWSDTKRHWEHGISILRDDPFIMGEAIMFQLYIAVLGKLTVNIPVLIAFYTILLSLLTPWIWYRFFRELQPSKLMAVAGWAGAALLPSWHSIYGYFMQETLMLPLLGAALYYTWRCKRKQTVSAFSLMILFWALAGLTRGICIPMAAVATVWLWVAQDQKLKKATVGVLLLGLMLGPLAYRTYDKIYMLAPHGVGHLNMVYAMSGKKEINIRYRRDKVRWNYGFMSPALLVKPFEPFSDWQTRRTGRVVAPIDVNKGSESWKKALAKIDLSFKDYLWITKENLIFLFFCESWPDSNRQRWLGNINYHMRWIWAPATLLILVWTLICWRRQRKHLLLPTLMLVWFIVQGLLPISVNEGRYRKPFEGLLIAQLVFLAGTLLQQPAALPIKATPRFRDRARWPVRIEMPRDQNPPRGYRRRERFPVLRRRLNSLLKSVTSAGQTRRNCPKKRSLHASK